MGLLLTLYIVISMTVIITMTAFNIRRERSTEQMSVRQAFANICSNEWFIHSVVTYGIIWPISAIIAMIALARELVQEELEE